MFVSINFDLSAPGRPIAYPLREIDANRFEDIEDIDAFDELGDRASAQPMRDGVYRFDNR